MQVLCSGCNGSGIDPRTGDVCTSCRGSGLVAACWYQAVTLQEASMQNKLDDILDKVNDIKEKCDEIFEKVNV